MKDFTKSTEVILVCNHCGFEEVKPYAVTLESWKASLRKWGWSIKLVDCKPVNYCPDCAEELDAIETEKAE